MFLAFLLVSLVMLFIMSYVNSKMDQMSSEEITYSRFLKMVEEDKVESVEIGSSEIKITPKEEKKDRNQCHSLFFNELYLRFVRPG